MAADKVILAGYVVRCPLGGYAWQALHYLVGLRALGFDPYFYEDTAYYGDCFDPTTGDMHVRPEAGVAFAARFFARYGFADHWAFWDAARDRYHGLSPADTATLLHDARILITLAAVNRLPRRTRQRRVFVDIDPTFTQLRAAQGNPALCELLKEHDLHFTVGENIGTAGCAIPTARLTWRPTRQPVATELWSPLDPQPQPPFTTIGRWDERRRDIEFGGERYSWSKRMEWMKFLKLPEASGEHFTLAMDVGKTPADAALLRRHGWEIIDPIAVSGDPWTYRDFVRHSKGEFTTAKDLNVRLASGWFSDRSACYLAAGRPVVTQDTGFERNLPTGKGLHAVRTLDDAVHALAAVSTNYASEARAAREIAETYFDGQRVLASLVCNLA